MAEKLVETSPNHRLERTADAAAQPRSFYGGNQSIIREVAGGVLEFGAQAAKPTNFLYLNR